MVKTRFVLSFCLLIAAVLILAGCTPRPGQGETAALPGAEQLTVDLPAIVIDIDAEGTPSLGGVPLAQLGSSFGAGGLDALTLPATQMEQITAANIQHLQINNTPAGLKLIVNGQEIPSLAWDSETLTQTNEAIGMLGGAVPPVVVNLLPALSRLGTGVIVRFPVGEGQEAIPLEVTGEGSAATEAQAAQAAFLESVGTPGRISISILYEPDGSWRLADLTDAEWTTLTGQAALANLRLPASMIEDLTSAGVSAITLATDADGIHIVINDKPLPYINWGDGKLEHVITLAGQMGVFDGLAGDGENTADVVAAIQQVLPLVTSSQL
jgi:hypothetical protein